jgi:glycosyltransferase involved in cell wall biosynthesis
MVVLSEHLRRRGHDVTAVCPPGGWITRQLAAAQVPMLEWTMHGLKAPATVLRLRSYVRENGIEMIHTHLTRAAYMGYIAGLLARVPVVSSVHTLTRDWVYRYLPQRNHWFIAVSQDLRRMLVDRGVPPDRIRTVYNGTDIGTRVVAPSALSVRAELGVPAQADLIGVFGRVDEFKGQHILVHAASRIVRECPCAYFVFVGHAEPEVQQGLWEIAGADGVADRLRFTGVRDDVPRMMDAMDVVALPSRTEACSMAIIEAMTMGKPVVATRAGGNPELIEDGVSGLLTERSAEAVGSAIVSLCRDHGRRAAMGAAARERALRFFSADVMAENMERLYNDVLGAARGD